MALYELNDSQLKFIRDMITMVTPQGMKREAAKQFIADGDDVLLQLSRTVHVTGKPKNFRSLTPDEQKKVINESSKEYSVDKKEMID